MKVYILYENDIGMSNFQAPTVHSIYKREEIAREKMNNLNKAKEDEYIYSVNKEVVIE